MELKHIHPPKVPGTSAKSAQAYHRLQTLLNDLRKKDLPEEITVQINDVIAGTEGFEGPEEKRVSSMNKARERILKRVREELGLVPKSYYVNLWLPLGMACFGIPLGVALSAFLDEPPLLASGISAGLGFGAFYGMVKDKKAARTGKVID